ncbi:hypothetical protein BU15DRAFT_88537 [Melanogaster broomeanus]|nr:hypothetical protein BU15DRAFT_88537 [Melanogaster broomeanus]
MYRKISRDVKLATINLYEHHHLSLEDLLACVRFSESTFWCILRVWHETGDVVKHTHGVHYLVRLIHHRPEWFLDELLNLLKMNHFVSAHYTTIHRELERVGISVKKLK